MMSLQFVCPIENRTSGLYCLSSGTVNGFRVFYFKGYRKHGELVLLQAVANNGGTVNSQTVTARGR